jgi:hypothetical protein
MPAPTFTRRAACRLLASTAAGWQALAAQHNMFLALNAVLISNRVPWPAFARLAAKVGFPGTDVDLDAAMKLGVTAKTTSPSNPACPNSARPPSSPPPSAAPA